MSAEPEPIRLRRVRKAYEQVAEQLRELILAGEIAPSQRLPNEVTLGEQFGVSRATIREALRVLSAQNLIRTTKGAGGGSFVTVPTTDHISASLGANFSLLSQSADITLQEFLEVRACLEVPAARLASQRRGDRDLTRLRASIPDEPLRLPTEQQFVCNKEFHSVIVQASGNALLAIAAEPVFVVLQTHLQRSRLGPDFHEAINADHRAILAAVESGEAEEAAARMQDHLEYLRPMYERGWRYKLRPDARG